jgi:hypothetical protein
MKLGKNEFYARIQVIDRLENSRNGNPRFSLVLWTGKEIIQAVTMSDASVGYEIGNLGLGKWDWVKVTMTPAGRIRFMEPVDVAAILKERSDG